MKISLRTLALGTFLISTCAMFAQGLTVTENFSKKITTEEIPSLGINVRCASGANGYVYTLDKGTGEVTAINGDGMYTLKSTFKPILTDEAVYDAIYVQQLTGGKAFHYVQDGTSKAKTLPALKNQLKTVDQNASLTPQKAVAKKAISKTTTDWEELGEISFTDVFLFMAYNGNIYEPYTVTIYKSKTEENTYMIPDVFPASYLNGIIFSNGTPIYSAIDGKASSLTLTFESPSQVVADFEVNLTDNSDNSVVSISQNNYGSFSNGKFNFPNAAFSIAYDGAVYANSAELEILLPGTSDYSVSLVNTGNICNSNNTLYFSAEGGADVANLKFYSSIGIQFGDDELYETTLQEGQDIVNGSCNLQLATPGWYTVCVISVTPEGTIGEAALTYFYCQFNFKEEDWVNLGQVHFTDDTVLPLFGITDNISYDITLFESKTQPGQLCMANPYDNSPYAGAWGYHDGDHNHMIYVDAEDPTRVFISLQPMGVKVNNVALHDFSLQTNNVGAINNGVLTFPNRGLVVRQADMTGYYANKNDKFTLEVPDLLTVTVVCDGVPVENATVGYDDWSQIVYTNAEGVAYMPVPVDNTKGFIAYKDGYDLQKLEVNADGRHLVAAANLKSTGAIAIEPKELNLRIGEKGKLTATVQPANVSGQTITWTSYNQEVATVAADGTVTAISVGTATITATCGAVSAICKVTVAQPETEYYIIGANVNGKTWTLAAEDAKFVYKGNNIYEWQGSVLGTGFKINDGTWTNPEVNFGSNGAYLVIGEKYSLNFTDRNIGFTDATEITNPKVTLDINDWSIIVEGEASGQYQWFIIGTFNDWSFDYPFTDCGDGTFRCDGVKYNKSSDAFFKIVTNGEVKQFGSANNDIVINNNNLSAQLDEVAGGDWACPIDLFSGTYDVLWNPNTATVTFMKRRSIIPSAEDWIFWGEASFTDGILFSAYGWGASTPYEVDIYQSTKEENTYLIPDVFPASYLESEVYKDSYESIDGEPTSLIISFSDPSQVVATFDNNLKNLDINAPVKITQINSGSFSAGTFSFGSGAYQLTFEGTEYESYSKPFTIILPGSIRYTRTCGVCNAEDTFTFDVIADKEVPKLKLLSVPGLYSTSDSKLAEVAANGSDINSGSNSVNLSGKEAGWHSIFVTTVDMVGNPVRGAVHYFYVKPEFNSTDWASLGEVDFTDDIILPLVGSNEGIATYKITLLESVKEPGTLCMVNPYDSHPYANIWYNHNHQHMVYLGASDPTAVTFEFQPLGVEFSMEEDWSAEAYESTGKIENGILTFPKNGLAVWDSDLNGYIANSDGRFALEVPNLLTVTVVNDGVPVENANVGFDDWSQVVYTNADGVAYMPVPVDNTKGFIVYKDGYDLQKLEVNANGRHLFSTANLKPTAAIVIEPQELNLRIGEKGKLIATVRNANEADQTIVWTSDNQEVATVAADGTVTAVSVGTATITAKAGTASATCKVNVSSAPTPITQASDYIVNGITADLFRIEPGTVTGIKFDIDVPSGVNIDISESVKDLINVYQTPGSGTTKSYIAYTKNGQKLDKELICTATATNAERSMLKISNIILLMNDTPTNYSDISLPVLGYALNGLTLPDAEQGVNVTLPVPEELNYEGISITWKPYSSELGELSADGLFIPKSAGIINDLRLTINDPWVSTPLDALATIKITSRSAVTLEQPDVEKVYGKQYVSVTHPVAEKISVTIGEGEATVMDLPAAIDIEPWMSSLEITALANDYTMNNSEPLTVTLETHKAPVISYDGHSVQFSVMDSPTEQSSAELCVYLNGEPIRSSADLSAIEMTGFGTVAAYVQSNYMFRSENSEIEINCYNTGSEVGIRNDARLKDCIGTWGERNDSYTNLHVTGDLTTEDISLLAALPALTTLNLEGELTGNGSFDNIFSQSPIETLALTSAATGMLKGMDRLTTVIWNRADSKMPDGLLSDNGNPNLLVWVKNRNCAPSDASNIVIYGEPQGGLITSDYSSCQASSDKITLVSGKPFNAFKPFQAAQAELTKEFTLETQKGVCRGWETLAVPFRPAKVSHETNGEMIPFVSWDGMDSSPRPYWLYRATSTGWIHAAAIEQGIPYIISVPKNKDYLEMYNLKGNVTFSAENVTLGSDTSKPRATDWVNGSKFIATYMPVDGNIWSLNTGDDTSDLLPGSAFVAGLPAQPFGAYVTSSTAQRVLPLFGDSDSVWLPVISTEGDLIVESPAPGTLKLLSTCDRTVTIHTVTGAVIRIVEVPAAEVVTVENLSAGVYFVGHEKVIVR